MSQTNQRINDFKLLRQLLTQDESGRQEYLYSRLKVGDMWWIPDIISGFGQKEKHPWVVVVDYKPNRPPVLACPRTTEVRGRKDELRTPAKVLDGLEKEGAILLGHRRPFLSEKFREFEYIGRLSDEWIRKLQGGMKKQIGSIR